MDTKVLDAIHDIQQQMLQKLHQRCKDEGIRYTLICGSLLGAIRHKGFIPWDDDVDIGLPREDYERLLESLKKEPIEGCFLQDYRTDAHYCQPFAKIIKNDTTYIEDFRKNCKARNGVFIDVFPLDYISSPGMKSTKFVRCISRMITMTIWHKEKCHMKRMGAKKLLNGTAAVLSILPKSFLIWLQNKLVIKKNKQYQYLGSLFSSNYETDRLYFDVSDFDELIEVPFEGVVANIPKNWEANLKRLYKNYMQFPPESKRNSGHDVCKIETGTVSYCK